MLHRISLDSLVMLWIKLLTSNRIHNQPKNQFRSLKIKVVFIMIMKKRDMLSMVKYLMMRNNKRLPQSSLFHHLNQKEYPLLHQLHLV